MNIKKLFTRASGLMLAMAVACCGGGGDGGYVSHVDQTLDVSVPKFLSGNSDIYLMNPSNGMLKVRIIANKKSGVSTSATEGTTTGTVTFTGAGMVLPYSSTFTARANAEGTELWIRFDRYLGTAEGARYVDDSNGTLCKQVMRVSSPYSLQVEDAGDIFQNKITVTLRFNPSTGIAQVIATTRQSGTGQFYNDEGTYLGPTDYPEWQVAARLWAQTCMETSYYAIQPKEDPQ